MPGLVETASLDELAALAHLKFLSAEDISAACMRLLEEDLDAGDADIAALAGTPDLTLADTGPVFDRILQRLGGGGIDHEDAILRALRLHLAAAMVETDLMGAVERLLKRFQSLSTQRLVRHPRRSVDHPETDYAEQELGLEYVYALFHSFDETWSMSERARTSWQAEVINDLRSAVRDLHDHLTTVLSA